MIFSRLEKRIQCIPFKRVYSTLFCFGYDYPCGNDGILKDMNINDLHQTTQWNFHLNVVLSASQNILYYVQSNVCSLSVEISKMADMKTKLRYKWKSNALSFC